MQEEAELIAKAIRELSPESNYFKDYMFPVVSGICSSLLGAGAAYFAMRYHENIQIEKHKMDVVNEFTMAAESCLICSCRNQVKLPWKNQQQPHTKSGNNPKHIT